MAKKARSSKKTTATKILKDPEFETVYQDDAEAKSNETIDELKKMREIFFLYYLKIFKKKNGRDG